MVVSQWGQLVLNVYKVLDLQYEKVLEIVHQ